MFELKTPTPKVDHPLAPGGRSDGFQEPKQRRMMLVALTLLLIALGVVLYHDRNFWFPDIQEADDQSMPQDAAPAAAPVQSPAAVAQPESPVQKKSHGRKPQKSTAAASAREPAPSTAPETTATDTDVPASTPPGMVTTTRTVLPPLEIEVVAGDVHRAVHPGSNAVRVDLQPGSPAQPVSAVPAPSSASAGSTISGSTIAGSSSDTTASVVRTAAERVQVSGDTAEIVSRPVQPGYPLLARQMKVQGSVILQALIGRDGLIQDLRVLSGPPILASAAQEAVKQWHFKPHYLGSDAVETQARITVNFTISTN